MSTSFSPLLTLVDAPARGAIQLTRVPVWRSLGLIGCGAGMVLVATAASAAMSAGSLAVPGAFAAHVVFAWLEALAVVVPSALLLFTYADLDFDARAVTAGVAVSLLTSGVVAVGIVPLVAYLVVMTRAAPLVSIGAVPTITALVAFAATFRRVGLSVDPSSRASLFIHGALVAFAVAFTFRVLSRMG